MNREQLIETLDKLCDIKAAECGDEIIRAFDAVSEAGSKYYDEKLKFEIEANRVGNENFELRKELKTVKEVRDNFVFKCNEQQKLIDETNQKLAERDATIKYLHKAMDAQQKALDKLRQADLPDTPLVQVFDATKTGVWDIEMPGCTTQAVEDQARRRAAMSKEAASFTQSGRCRARQLLNDLSTNRVQTYQGQRESQLIDVLLLILDELPPVEAKRHYVKANGIVRT